MRTIHQAEPARPTKALLYCRVSTKKQRDEGHGLDSQEHRCRQYADAKGYEVEAVFPDDVSGGGDFMKRPGMVALLAYMDARADERFVVIFDDLKRYARDTEFHLRLRRIMAERGAVRECLNFNFEDTPEGEFNETIAAAAGALERKQLARQTRQKMQARMEKGYYCFPAVRGYKYVPSRDGGKILVPDEPVASAMREVFEGLACGRFHGVAEVKRFLDQSPAFRTEKGGMVWQAVAYMLRSPLYAGRITKKEWGLHLHPAQHAPIVSLDVWQKAQDRLDGRSTPARKDYRDDFPLRNWVCCAACGHPMTAAWSKGRSAQYPYYVCYRKGCDLKGKSVRKERVESDFEALLKSLKPAPVLMTLFRDMFAKRWDEVGRSGQEHASAARAGIASLDAKIGKLVDRIVGTENARVIKAYEDQINVLEEEKIRLGEIAAGAGKPRTSFNESFRTACAFLANPWKLWVSDRPEHRRILLRLAFTGPVPYCRNEGFRTAGIAEPLRLLRSFSVENIRMVGPAGFEPATTPL